MSDPIPSLPSDPIVTDSVSTISNDTQTFEVTAGGDFPYTLIYVDHVDVNPDSGVASIQCVSSTDDGEPVVDNLHFSGNGGLLVSGTWLRKGFHDLPVGNLTAICVETYGKNSWLFLGCNLRRVTLSSECSWSGLVGVEVRWFHDTPPDYLLTGAAEVPECLLHTRTIDDMMLSIKSLRDRRTGRLNRGLSWARLPCAPGKIGLVSSNNGSFVRGDEEILNGFFGASVFYKNVFSNFVYVRDRALISTINDRFGTRFIVP